uniref:F-box associated beta-propeller type 1 domain-containing protein n=2 Tax=Chenopodium quinoa TaxID=63459 RepID=A0A803L8R9_CHEQI
MNDYKLLAIGFIKSTEYSIAVYSLNDHLWRIKDRLDVHIQGILSFYLGNVIHLKGSMYCIGFDWYSSDPASGLQTHLASFDFDLEEFGFVELPDAAKQNKVKFNFVLGESIAVFSMSSEHTCIWVLIEVGGQKSWQLWYNGDSNLTALQFFKSSTFTKIFHVEENTFFVQRSPNLYSYNFRSHLIQHLNIDGCKSLETFVESLVLHKGNQGKNLSHETDFIQINGE